MTQNALMPELLRVKGKAMTSHERASDGTEEWLTPPAIIQALGPFDLDPCAPVCASDDQRRGDLPLDGGIMNEHPILFSASMVKAILEGRKTQTRRVVKGLGSKLGDEYCTELRNGEIVETATLCPYGKAGTRLWVRETWRLASVNASILNAQFWTVQFKDFAVLPHPQPARELFVPLAAKDTFTPGQTGIEFGKWRPSIFLPRWASRITLEVLNVRVERVQDISEEDARAEGVVRERDTLDIDGRTERAARPVFPVLWDSINAKRGYGWDANPWVWVIEFKQVQS